METKNSKETLPDLSLLINELIYHRYLFSRETLQDLNVMEYIALHFIVYDNKASSVYGDRTYLQDISDRIHLTIRQTSKMMGKLRDAGLVLWSHDGNGSEGTYVIVTDSGRRKLEEQEERLKSYYAKVIEKIGKEKLIQMLQIMKELEGIMNSERQENHEDNE